MKVVAKNLSEVQKISDINDMTEIKLSHNREYEVYSVISSPYITLFTIVNDAQVPVHYPAEYFSVIEYKVDPDWFVNSTDEYPIMMGPSFVVKDSEKAVEYLNSEERQLSNLIWHLRHNKGVKIQYEETDL